MIGLAQLHIVPRRPSHIRRLLRDVTRRPYALAKDGRHVQEAVGWLVQAQNACGGRAISGGYSMNAIGWAPADLIASVRATPVLLAAADWLGNQTLVQKATAVGNWMISTQSSPESLCRRLDNSLVLTAACVSAYTALFNRCGDERFLSAARASSCRLASRIERSSQYRHALRENGLHAAQAILEYRPFDDRAAGDAIARRLVQGVVETARPNGWLGSFGEQSDVSVRTSRVATTAQSLFCCAGLLEGPLAGKAEQVAVDMAERTMLRFERNKPRPDGEAPMLAEFFDSKWRLHGSHACNAGSAQMARLWLTAYRHTDDARFVNAALKILDQLKSQQALDSTDSTIRGAVPGTMPIWRSAGRPHFPTLVTSALVAALIRQERVIEELQIA